MAACLAFGPPVAVYGVAAARLWGWEEIGSPPVLVAVPRTRSARRQGVTATRVALIAEDITSRARIPVTSPVRTVVDLARRLPDRQVGSFVDHILASALTTPSALEHHLAGAKPGSTPRLGAVRRVVGLRSEYDELSESAWEDRLCGWLRDAGLPVPVRQHEVLIGTEHYRLDLAYPAERVAVEFDGWAFHRSRRRFDSDRERTTELELAGWLVILVTSGHDRAMTIARISRALEQRADRRGGYDGHPDRQPERQRDGQQA